MEGEQLKERFLAELRKVLQDLYDPVALQRSVLLSVLASAEEANPPAALRRAVVEAIGQLKPSTDIPPYAAEWRIYHILISRYIEQSSQCTVAANLGLSIRQLRRQERVAERLLADRIWARRRLGAMTTRLASIFADAEVPAQETDGGQTEELDWLRRSASSTRMDLAALIAAAQQVITPLARKDGIEIAVTAPAELPPVMGQPTAARQALLSLLTAALHAAPAGQVTISAAAIPHGVELAVRARARVGAPTRQKVNEHLEMARQLAEVCGAALTAAREDAEGQDFVARLSFTEAEKPVVLVIDDNTDTLRLFERYLTGSRYRFVGQPNPMQALATVAALAPDVIVLDVMLPEIDGWELLGRLREHPQTSCAPVIVCTILPQESLALTLGAAAFLRKPVTREAFLALLDQVADLTATAPT